ncbi:MAG: FG-GAP repeat protein [Phycisphaerales bacterium]
MRHTYILCVSLAACLSWSVVWPAAAYADLGDQLFKLLPDDGAAVDVFGRSVAISGATAIVGAEGHGDNGFNSGSAYLFDAITGKQLFKLLANDGAEGDHFGRSVAISGATAIVGARGDDDNGSASGSAYLFEIATGAQLAKLLPNDGFTNDRFGGSVAIGGGTAIVGANQHDDNGFNSGSAYLFDAITGKQLFKLLPNDGAADDLFGFSVAISGATAIVGAHFDDDNGLNSGSAYLFDTTTGRQLFKLLPADGAGGDDFGVSVAISGAIAIVGAQVDDDNGTDSGSVYVFDISDPANPTQLFKLLPNDGAADEHFGHFVAITGATAIVGANWDDDNGEKSGSAYLFDSTTGQQLFKLLPDDGAEFDNFGGSVAISGTTAIVGASFDDDNGNFSGSAYLFDASSCPWDLDDDAVVGASDLLSLLVSWGPCKGCPADFDGNGIVGASDLLALLVNWGPCP